MQRVDVAWCKRDCPSETLRCLEAAAEIPECQTAVIASRRVCRPDRQNLLEGGKRLLMPLQGIEDDAVIDQGIRRARADFERRRNKAQRVGRATLLVSQRAH